MAIHLSTTICLNLPRLFNEFMAFTLSPDDAIFKLNTEMMGTNDLSAFHNPSSFNILLDK